MVLLIRNVTVHRKLMPITRTEPYRSNYTRELMPITYTEPYRSNWTRDVNGELQLIFVFILEFWLTLTFFRNG